MSLVTECFENIIGLSRNECNCFEEGRPEDYDTSQSDLFLDETEGLELNMAGSLNDCSEGSLWDMLAKSRSEAIKSFVADMTNELLKRSQLARIPYRGLLGENDWTKNFTLTKDMAGRRLVMPPVRSGTMKLKRIGLLFTQNETFNIGLYSNLSEDVIETFEVTCQANKLTWFTLPDILELPMFSYEKKYIEYFFIYENTGNYPKDNQIACGSCGSWYFYKDSPSFTSNKNTWATWVMDAGIEGNVFSDRINWNTYNRGYGLLFDVQFSCNVGETICKDGLDFTGNPLNEYAAWAIRVRAAHFLVKRLLNQSDPSVYSMIGADTLANNAAFFLQKYTELIEYLATQWSGDQYINWNNDCLECKQPFGFAKKGIRA